jgi:hypothetical protein
MNDLALKQFIYKASRATYASGDESIKTKQLDESTTIQFTDGEYVYHDNYFGGEPYGGREVVFYNNKPVWMMVYYGLVYEGANSEVYNFLMQALSNNTEDSPYRGPINFKDKEWEYKNVVTGNVDKFSGIEKIFRSGKCVYEASYIGGYVNR